MDLVNQLPGDRPILFAPDQNLGRWVQLKHQEAQVLAHPECQQHLLDLADFIGSTSALLRQAEQSAASTFIVQGEPGISQQMGLKLP